MTETVDHNEGFPDAGPEHRPGVRRCERCSLRMVGTRSPVPCMNCGGNTLPVLWRDECLAAEGSLESLPFYGHDRKDWALVCRDADRFADPADGRAKLCDALADAEVRHVLGRTESEVWVRGALVTTLPTPSAIGWAAGYARCGALASEGLAAYDSPLDPLPIRPTEEAYAMDGLDALTERRRHALLWSRASQLSAYGIPAQGRADIVGVVNADLLDIGALAHEMEPGEGARHPLAGLLELAEASLEASSRSGVRTFAQGKELEALAAEAARHVHESGLDLLSEGATRELLRWAARETRGVLGGRFDEEEFARLMVEGAPSLGLAVTVREPQGALPVLALASIPGTEHYPAAAVTRLFLRVLDDEGLAAYDGPLDRAALLQLAISVGWGVQRAGLRWAGNTAEEHLEFNVRQILRQQLDEGLKRAGLEVRKRVIDAVASGIRALPRARVVRWGSSR